MTDPNTAARDRAHELVREGRDPRLEARTLSLQAQHLDALAHAVQARDVAARAEESLVETARWLAETGVEPPTPEGDNPETLRRQALSLTQEAHRLDREGGRLAERNQLPSVADYEGDR
jgi:hypothetical protein